jgi:hypothetical protein
VSNKNILLQGVAGTNYIQYPDGTRQYTATSQPKSYKFVSSGSSTSSWSISIPQSLSATSSNFTFAVYPNLTPNATTVFVPDQKIATAGNVSYQYFCGQGGIIAEPFYSSDYTKIINAFLPTIVNSMGNSLTSGGYIDQNGNAYITIRSSNSVPNCTVTIELFPTI